MIVDFYKKHLLIAVVAAFFLCTMVCRLTYSPLWGDELVEFWVSRLGIFDKSMYYAIRNTFQPPLYNLMMHFWLKVSTDLLWFRLFNVAVGCVTGCFTFRSVAKMYGSKAACCSLVGLAACYQWVYCIQECSEYALMLMFIAAAIYCYQKLFAKYSLCNLFCFIACCVGAVYSQYGAVFAIAPLLILHLMRSISDARQTSRDRLVIAASYCLSFLIFVLPLYVKFLHFQMHRRKLASHIELLGWDCITDFPITIGKILGYFYNFNEGSNVFFPLIGILFLILALSLILNRSVEKVARHLLTATLMAYLAHYVLVKLHVYAMLHTNESAGFMFRYSYFYMPMLAVAVPIVIIETSRLYPKAVNRFKIKCLAAAFMVIPLSSCCDLKDNWRKSNNDVISDMWWRRAADTNVRTYLLGSAPVAFNYYISERRKHRWDSGDFVFEFEKDQSLPCRFWIWHEGYSSDQKGNLLAVAHERGYAIEKFVDDNCRGSLYYCETRKNDDLKPSGNSSKSGNKNR